MPSTARSLINAVIVQLAGNLCPSKPRHSMSEGNNVGVHFKALVVRHLAAISILNGSRAMRTCSSAIKTIFTLMFPIIRLNAVRRSGDSIHDHKCIILSTQQSKTCTTCRIAIANDVAAALNVGRVNI